MSVIAILAHNEMAHITRALNMAAQAARPEDEVIVVDSGSTDATAAVAKAAGYDVLMARLGKAEATLDLFGSHETDWYILMDADVVAASSNLVAPILEATKQADAPALLLGDFEDWRPGSVLSSTRGIYEPTVAALFPSLTDRCGIHPLTGFRAVRSDLAKEVPQSTRGFALESAMNCIAAARGIAPLVIPLGKYAGPFKYKPTMAMEIGRGVLDTAEQTERLSRTRRPAWDQWVKGVADVIATYRGDPDERLAFLKSLERVRRTPLPARI